MEFLSRPISNAQQMPGESGKFSKSISKTTTYEYRIASRFVKESRLSKSLTNSQVD